LIVSHEDEDAGVEAVRPSGIGRRGQLVALKQIVDVAQHQRVGVEEDALVELRQSPAVQLRERDSKLRPRHADSAVYYVLPILQCTRHD